MTVPDDSLIVAEVASILKLNKQAVRNWIDQGKLPALHIGPRVRIRRSGFDASSRAARSMKASRLHPTFGRVSPLATGAG